MTGRKYTYDQLRIKTGNFNRGLRKIFNLQKGDVVGILLPNLPEYPIATLGIIQAGLICTTMNPIYTAGKLIFFFKTADVFELVLFLFFRRNWKTIKRFKCKSFSDNTRIMAKRKSSAKRNKENYTNYPCKNEGNTFFVLYVCERILGEQKKILRKLILGRPNIT